MINANNLRIGNWIRKIDGRGHYQVDAEIICSLANSTPEEMEEEPIPLNEEWLLRFGFVKDKQRRSKLRDFTGWTLRTHWNYCKGYDPHFAINLFDNGDAPAGIFCFGEWNCGGSFSYVHQLQNLFHALTGEELQ